jgi:hypothetical protein
LGIAALAIALNQTGVLQFHKQAPQGFFTQLRQTRQHRAFEFARGPGALRLRRHDVEYGFFFQCET